MLIKSIIGIFISKEFIRFLLVGGTAAAINFGSRFLFRVFFPYVLSVALAFSLGTVVSFILNKVYTFKAFDESTLAQLVKFVAIAVVSIGIASFTVYSGMEIYKYIGITWITEREMESVMHLVAIGVVMIFNFLAMKYFSFRRLSLFGR